jgi:hypothetical protein
VDVAECTPKTFTRFYHGPEKLTCRIAHHTLVTSLLLSNLTISDQISRRSSVWSTSSACRPPSPVFRRAPAAPLHHRWGLPVSGGRRGGVTLVEVFACPRESIYGGILFRRVPWRFGIWCDFGSSGTLRSGIKHRTEKKNVSFKREAW